MSVPLDSSYAFCRSIARRRARNFYYSFLLLSSEQKNGMCAVYAFMRFCDDLSDEAGASAAAIDQWRNELDMALRGEAPEHALWPAFCDTVERYSIPRRYFHEMIDGVRSDLEPRRIETFEDLYRYCYQVASVVGLAVINIFGFSSPDAPGLAERCGIAFQLTNILRDVREDAERGRVYLPAEDLARFNVDATHFVNDRRFVDMMRHEARRARAYYEEARPLVAMVAARSRSSLWALIEIYSRLLDRIERSNFDVLEQRIRVPAWEKALIVAQALLRSA
jgi:phytoene synthase